MLKFILPVILLMNFSSGWGTIQIGLIISSFFFLSLCCCKFSIFNLGYGLGVDGTSYLMILLSIWIIMLVLLISQKFKSDSFYFCLTNLSLLFFLVMTFCSLDYLMLYIMFEACLFPTLILILGWGYQPERIQAGVYMIFYTLVFSIPLLLSFIVYYWTNFSSSIFLGGKVSVYGYEELCWFLITISGFLVKLPVYMVHLWLPKAHVEAPLAGSMILAGILLKLGGYGLIRVLALFEKINSQIYWSWVSWGLLGGSYISFLCLRQVDMKSLIAYSSVAHMSMVFCGLMVLNLWGVKGAIIIMVGHGLCSSGLFCLANIMYERVGSRSMILAKGLLSFMPSMGLWWFLLSVSNMASPPSLNLLGEISLIISLVSWSKLTLWGISVLSFFSASYTLYMYTLSQHGVFYNSIYSCCSGNSKEYLNLFLHWLPLNVLIMNTNMFLSLKKNDLKNLY